VAAMDREKAHRALFQELVQTEAAFGANLEILQGSVPAREGEEKINKINKN
jgi:hypothetical protein